MPAVCPWSSITYDGKEIPVRKNGVAVKPPWGGKNVLVSWSKDITTIVEFVAKIDKTIGAISSTLDSLRHLNTRIDPHGYRLSSVYVAVQLVPALALFTTIDEGAALPPDLDTVRAQLPQTHSRLDRSGIQRSSSPAGHSGANGTTLFQIEILFRQ